MGAVLQPGRWTEAAPQKESPTLRYYEAAIWEETDSVHLYAFPNDYDPIYGVFGNVTEDDVIAYREQYAVSVHTGMPEESSDERSDFLRGRSRTSLKCWWNAILKRSITSCSAGMAAPAGTSSQSS